MIALIDGVERISRRVPDRQRRRREERPFPSIGDEEDVADETPGHTPETETGSHPDDPASQTRVDDDDEHRIDITVAGRFLPTRQFLPGAARPATIH